MCLYVGFEIAILSILVFGIILNSSVIKLNFFKNHNAKFRLKLVLYK